MKYTNILIIVFLLLQFAITNNSWGGNFPDSLTQEKSCFYSAKQELSDMLGGKIPLSYERAVFLTENAYWGNIVDYSLFKNLLDFHTENIKKLVEANRDYSKQNFKPTMIESEGEKKLKYEKALANRAIFSYMTDTAFFMIDSSLVFYHLPYKYSSNDPLGTIKWKNSQIFNLLDSHEGNCYALTSLYKIFSERLKTEANICTAPGHIYIRHADQKGILYNVELATRAFPGTGSIETLTYTTDEATKNNISLRTLDLKQSVALCLVYLAKGFEYKFKIKDDGFMLHCAELALRYDSLNLNAMLLKSEVLEEKIIKSKKAITQLQGDKDFKQHEKLIARLYQLGYREMPIEMKNIVISRLRNDSIPIIVRDQTPQPFQNLAVTDSRYATLSWGLFDEIHEEKPFEKYQRTVFDTKKKKITNFVPEDTTYNKYPIDMVVFAWGIDPLARKYPSISPYVGLGDNPILFVDKDGQKLFVAGNTSVALADIQSLIPKEYHSQIKVTNDNQIIFESFDQLPKEIQQYEGISLLNNLISSEKNYKYSISDVGTGRERTGDKKTTGLNLAVETYDPPRDPTPQNAILNFSTTERSDYPTDDIANFLPEEGFQGSVTIREGEFSRSNPETTTGSFPYLRSKVVFHELLENYLRTEKGLDYPGTQGAHEKASDKASKFSKELTGKGDPYGGYGNQFTPKKEEKKK